MKILHHGTQHGDLHAVLRENLRWKRCTTMEKVTYVCMDKRREVCAVLLSKAFVIELWDMRSLPSVMSRLTICSQKLEMDQQFLPLWARDCQCQCMAWSDCKQYVCGVFGTNHSSSSRNSSSTSSSSSNNPSSMITVFLMWDVETGLLVATRKLPCAVVSAAILPLVVSSSSPLFVLLGAGGVALSTGQHAPHIMLDAMTGNYTLLQSSSQQWSTPLFDLQKAPTVDVESDSIENNDDHHGYTFVDTALSALAFAVDNCCNSLDTTSVGFVYVMVRDSDADGDRLLKLGILSTPVSAADTTTTWSNPFCTTCTTSLVPSTASQASSSAIVVRDITLQGTTNLNSSSSSQLLLLLCSRHPQGEVTEIRLLNSVTLGMLAILDVAATVSRPVCSLASKGHTATKLHTTTEDRHNHRGSGFEYFYGAVILSNYSEHSSSSSAAAAAIATGTVTQSSERTNGCLIAILVKASKLTNHQPGSRSGSQTAANNTSGSFDDSCKLLFWQPVIDDVTVAGAVQTGRSKSSSSDGMPPITLLSFPFRCILSMKGRVPRSRFSSSDGSLCNGFLAGPPHTGILPPTVVGTDGTLTSMASQWRCNILFTMDNEEQLWSASTERTTNFPGPMYPPGFQIMTRVENYVEREDDLDFVVSSSSNVEGNDSIIGDSELLQKHQPQVVNFINVGVVKRSSNKLPLRILSAAEREELMCMASHQQPTTASLETVGKKRKRAAEEIQQQSASVDAENVVAAPVVEGPRGLSLLDVLPLPRRVYTGDFALRMSRERQIGNALNDFCLNPSAVAERLMEFEKEAADNVRRAEINKEKARRRQKAIKDEKNRQRLLLEQAQRAAAAIQAAAAKQAAMQAAAAAAKQAVAVVLQPTSESSSSSSYKEGDTITDNVEGEGEGMQVVAETLTDERAMTVSE